VTLGLYLAMIAAGALGAVARAALSGYVQRRWQQQAAVGTLVVNLTGAFTLGLWVGWSAGHDLAAPWTPLVGGGFLGAFTTFSTWMVELAALWRAGRRRTALFAGGGTLLAGVTATWFGAWLGIAAATPQL